MEFGMEIAEALTVFTKHCALSIHPPDLAGALPPGGFID
jgi:hypothetical protein